jgi:hypothetical protein
LLCLANGLDYDSADDLFKAVYLRGPLGLAQDGLAAVVADVGLLLLLSLILDSGYRWFRRM